MRTVRFNITPRPSITVNGECAALTEAHGTTTVSYTGTLTLGGKLVLSPQQLLDSWRASAEAALADGDQAERLGRAAELELAKGRALAYGHMYDVTSKCLAQSASPDQIVEALKVLHTSTVAKLPAPSADQAAAFAEIGAVLAAGADAWHRAAALTWIADHN